MLMFIVLFIALLSTFILINIMFAEYVESKINVYKDAELEEKEKVRIVFKYILMLIMAIFWSWFIVLNL